MKLLLIVAGFICALSIGCTNEEKSPEKSQTTSATAPSIFPNLDTGRLSSPSGWDQFESQLQDASIQRSAANMPVSIEVAGQLAEQARKFAESDRRPHPHDLPLIPSAMLLAAQVYAEAGKQDEALSLLKDVRKYGGADVEMLKKPEFASLRESKEFSQIMAFGEAETDDQMFAGYLIQSSALFPLQDLLMLETAPAMPSADSTRGKVTVVYTGPKLMPDAI